jgi:TM2 domain-containing membrane protein YozV
MTQHAQNPAYHVAKPASWTWKLAGIVTIVFLIIGIYQSIKGPTTIELLKSDFSNFSNDIPTDTVLDSSKDSGLEYTVSSGRRSTTTYYYMLVKTQGKKLILETTDRDELKAGERVAIKGDVSSKTEDNLENIRKITSRNIVDGDLRLSEDEARDVKVLKHFSEGDKSTADYWGWYGFAIAGIIGAGYYIPYFFENKKYQQYLDHVDEIHKVNIRNQETHHSTNLDDGTKNLQNESEFTQKPQSAEPPKPHHHTVEIEKNTNPIDSEIISAKKSQHTSKSTYAILAILFGVLGLHQFYNGKIWFGFLHLIWLPLTIIAIISPQQLGGFLLLAILIFPISALVGIIMGIVRLVSKE